MRRCFPATLIRHMSSGVPRVRLLCPFRAYVFLVSRSLILIADIPCLFDALASEFASDPSPCFKGFHVWVFFNLVVASHRHHGGFGSMSVGPHQMCVLSTSYSIFRSG